MRRRNSSILGNAVLIGAATVLLGVIATYLSYGANNGLPFVPSTKVTLDVPNAYHLTKNADVKLAGTRIGRVASSEAIPHPNGVPTARLHLELSRHIGRLPVDTRFRIEPVSNAGRDYVDVQRGHSRRLLPEGAVVPARRVLPNVPLEDFLSQYTATTREGVRQGLQGFAYGLAGRGAQLNETVVRLVSLVDHLEPAARLLREPSTGLPRLIVALRRLSSEVAPVAGEQADGFEELNRTFAALSDDRAALGHAIDAGPPAADAIVHDAPAVTTFLASATRLSDALAPGAGDLPLAARTLSRTLRAGQRGLPATTRTLPRLSVLARAIGDFAQAPPVIPAVDRLGLLGRTLVPLTSFLTPAQTTCQYGALLLRNLASALKEGPASGNALRVVIIALTAGPDAEAGIASRPSRNKDDLGIGALHSNPYPSTAAPGQPHSCEAGQEQFTPGRAVIGHPAKPTDAVTESPR